MDYETHLLRNLSLEEIQQAIAKALGDLCGAEFTAEVHSIKFELGYANLTADIQLSIRQPTLFYKDQMKKLEQPPS